MGELVDLWRRVRNRHDDDRGASLVEYALLLALIAVVCVAAVSYLGHTASSSYLEGWKLCGKGRGCQRHVHRLSLISATRCQTGELRRDE